MWIKRKPGRGGIFFFVCLCVCCGLCSGKTVPSGLITVKKADWGREGYGLMLRDDEPPEVMFDAARRSFYADCPLQVALTREGKLSVRFYSPRGIRGVTVWLRCALPGERIKLAVFDSIPAFAEFDIPWRGEGKDCWYETSCGRKAVVSLRRMNKEKAVAEVECDDPYYRKLQAIRCRWKVGFGAYSGKNWRLLLPAHAREAVAVTLNLAYLFSTQEFREELSAWRGRLYRDNRKTPVNVEKLYENILRVPVLRYGNVTGVNGLGGGYVLGLAEWCYLEHYADDKCVTHTIFHEFAHCLGYTHEGNMTYENGLGRGWVSICGELYRRMCREKKLPVYSREFLNSRESPQLYTRSGDSRKGSFPKLCSGNTVIPENLSGEIGGGKEPGR